jgi:hypothetical protein
MFARTTLFEVDTMRISLDAALARFRETVLPRLQAHPECRGVLVLDTPDGRGMLISFWTSAEAADQTLETGFYDEQVAQFLMFLKQPPGREHYEVVLFEMKDQSGDGASSSVAGVLP